MILPHGAKVELRAAPWKRKTSTRARRGIPPGRSRYSGRGQAIEPLPERSWIDNDGGFVARGCGQVRQNQPRRFTKAFPILHRIGLVRGEAAPFRRRGTYASV